MKILRIITRLNVGGPTIQACDLTQNLALGGYACLLITGNIEWNESHDLEKEILTSGGITGYSTLFCPGLKRGMDWKQDLQAFLWIRKRIKVYRPDIIHTHMAKAGFIGRLAALTVKPRPRLVHTFHGHVFHSYFGLWKTRFYLFLERWLSKRTDVVIAISESQKIELEGYGIKNLRMISLGFDLERFLNIKPFTYVKGESLNIGLVGRLTAIKKPHLFLDLIEAVLKLHPVQGWIIGEGEMEREIRQAITSRGLPIEIMKYDHSNIHRAYEGLDIVACTSKNEGTPVSLIEAMASGRLVISTPVGGCVDLLGYDSVKNTTRRGMLLDNIEDAAVRLVACLKEGIYLEMADAARQYIEENYKLERLIDDIKQIYKEILK